MSNLESSLKILFESDETQTAEPSPTLGKEYIKELFMFAEFRSISDFIHNSNNL